MTPEFFAAIAPQIRTVTDQISLHVLGEPLTHPHLEEFFELSSQTDLRVNITTNGTLIARHPEVLHPAVRQINFSLQALEHGNNPAKILDDILAFSDKARQLRPDLYINFRLWNHESSLFDAGQPQNTHIVETICAHLAVPVPTFTAGRKSRNLTGRIYLHLDTLFQWPGKAETEGQHRGFCHALSTHCAILADGTVCPCCLDGDATLDLGNLHASSLAEILLSPRAITMREGFTRRQLVEPFCQTCTYCRRFTAKKASQFSPRS